MTRSPVLMLLAVVMSATIVTEAQLFSSASRFSSSGLVFPGPPGQGQQSNGNQGRQQQRPLQNKPVDEPSRNPQQFSPKADAEEDSFAPILPNFVRPLPQSQQPQQARNQQRPDADRPTPQALTGQALPIRVNTQSREQVDRERFVPPIPLSLVGQQPEEFLSAVQQRQQQQQRPQPQAAPVRSPPKDLKEEEEELLDEEEIQEELQFIPRQQPQQRPQPSRPSRPEVERQEVRRPPPPQEFQRPEPSIQQPVQQRRPNYPSDYKPSRPQQGNRVDGGPPRRPPVEPEELPIEEEEEEEVKPDKLQLLLQKTDFSCADKKDGYYADETVDCEIFHYCQDRLRHSWLCPEGATFHQVHLICMPVNKDNICKKSSQFHFVNDYLYKTLEDEDGNNDTNTYADRYYPDGYEPGTFDFAEMDEVKQPPRQNFQSSNRRQAASIANHQKQRRPQQPNQYARDRYGSDDNRRRVEPRRPSVPQIDADDEDEPFSNQPTFRSGTDFERRDRPQLDLSEEVDQ